MTRVRTLASILGQSTVASTGGGGGGATSYANAAALPSSGNTAGDLAFTLDKKALYNWDGAEWDRIYSGPNETLTWDSALPSAINLEGAKRVAFGTGDSSRTVFNFSASADAEGFPVTYSYETIPSNPVQLDSAFGGGTGILDSSDHPSRPRITLLPSMRDSDAGDFTFRVKATDGTHVITSSSLITLKFGLANVYGFRYTQTSYDYGHTVFDTLILSPDGQSIHDETNFGTEATWSPTPSWGNSTAEAQPAGPSQTYFLAEAAATFDTTLNTGFKRAWISEGTANATFDLKWTTPRIVAGILMSGDQTNGYDYWTGGYVQAYIGGNTVNDLVSTQYTFVANTTSSAAACKYYDFRV